MVSPLRIGILALPAFRTLPARFWVRTAQMFVGLFFLSAAWYKLENYFLVGDQSLSTHFHFWMSNGWPPAWYATLMEWMLRSENFFEALTIFLQVIPAVLLVLGKKVRLAGVILFLIQLNIFLGTFHHRHFNEFVGLSLWLALVFILVPDRETAAKKGRWRMCTVVLVALLALHLFNRFRIGDPWPSHMGWQREHLAADIVSVSLAWKWLVLALSRGAFGALLFAGIWWLKLALTIGCLTPKRLEAGALLLIIALFQSWTWMNSLTSHGVLWLLVLFSFSVQERYFQWLSEAENKTL